MGLTFHQGMTLFSEREKSHDFWRLGPKHRQVQRRGERETRCELDGNITRESTQIRDPLKCTGKGIFNYIHQHSYDFTVWQLHIERHPQGRNIEQILCFLWFSSAVITCCPFILLSYRAFSSYIILAVGNGRLVAWECTMLIVWRSLF